MTTAVAIQPASPARRQTTHHATQLRELLDRLDDLANSVIGIYRARRVDDTSEPLWDAHRHLKDAWTLLESAHHLCTTEGV